MFCKRDCSLVLTAVKKAGPNSLSGIVCKIYFFSLLVPGFLKAILKRLVQMQTNRVKEKF